MKVIKCILAFEQWSKMHVTTGLMRWKREWDRVRGLNGTSPLPHIQTDKPALPSAHGAGSNYNGKMHRTTRTKTWKKKTLQVLLQVSLGRGKPGTNCKKKKKKKGDGGRLREVGGDGGEKWWWGSEGREKNQRKRFIYLAVYKTDATWGLIVTEISKLVVCWVGWKVAAAAVWSIAQPLVFSLKALEKPLGARRELKQGGEYIQYLSASLFLSLSVSLSPPFLSLSASHLRTNCKNSFRRSGMRKYALLGQDAWKHFALSMNARLPVFPLRCKFDLNPAPPYHRQTGASF